MWPLQSNVGSGQPCRMTGGISLQQDVDVVSLLTSAIAAGATVIEISDRVVFRENITIPAGTILWMKSGGRLVFATGVTVTHLGTIIAPRRQIFYGGGSINGLKFVMPEWHGAKRDSATDDGAAFNLSIASLVGSTVSDGEELHLSLSGGVYGIATQINTSPTANRPFRIRGAGKTSGGTRLLALSTGAAGSCVLALNGALLDNSSIIDVVVSGLSIASQVPSSGMATALRIGTADVATRLIGVGYSLVSDVYIENFATGIDLVNCRLFKFDRVDIWQTGMIGAATSINARISGASNCGDFIFTACNFVMPDTTVIAPIANQYCVAVTASGGDYSPVTGAYSISGFKFYACNLYGGDQTVRMYVQDGARAAEFFFGLFCQWDQTANRRVYLEANKNGASTPVIETIQIQGCWLSESLAGAIVCASTGAAGIIRGLSVTDTVINLAQAEVLNLFGAAGAIKNTVFCRNRIYDANNHNGGATGKCIDLSLSYDSTCNENVFANTVTANFYNIAVSIGLGNVGATVCNNNTRASPPTAAIVADASGAVTKNIGTNI